MGRRLVLSPEQGEAFRRDGFLLYGQLLSQSEVEELRRQVEAIADGEYPYPSELIRFQPQSATGHLQDVPRHDRLYQIRYPHRHHPAFLEHARNANILDVVGELMGPDIVLYNTQVIFKPPFYGADVPWHQDSAYWPIDPPDLVSCWVALEEATVQNGCMRFIPASHRQGLVEHRECRVLSHASGGTASAVMQAQVDESQVVYAPMPAGHCSFHHSLTLHNTLVNKTPTRRRAVISHYMRADSRYTGPQEEKPKFLVLRGRSGPICYDA